jgi:hypothetical protein
MSRTVQGIVAVALLAASAGCCAGPYRFFQNAYGWNNPDTEYYCPGPPPPVTTPPGYSSPVVPEQVIARTGRTSPGVNVPRDAAPPTEVLPEESPLPDDDANDQPPPREQPESEGPASEPTSLRGETVVPASYHAPERLPPVEEPVEQVEAEAADSPTYESIEW